MTDIGLAFKKPSLHCNTHRQYSCGVELDTMILSHWILLLLSVAAAPAAASRSQRTRRGILELGGAIRCSTGRNPLSYIMYGCYCGLGGRGWPRDGVDWCCHRHDCCYEEAENLKCRTKTDRYKWKCEDNTVKCDGLEDKCEKMMCKCDRDVAKCLRTANFHKRYATMINFFCGSKQAMCSIYS